MPVPVAVPLAIEGAGIALNAIGGLRASRAARAEARRRRALADINAQSRMAAGQAAGFEEERQAQLVASRALALAAASGASASGRSNERNIASIGAEGAYRAALQVYSAEEDARMIRLSGRLEAAALNDQARGLQIGAAADLFTGAGSLYSKYGGKGPSGTDGTG